MANNHPTAEPRQEAHVPNIVFLDRNTLPAEVLLRDLNFPSSFTIHDNTLPEEVASRIADADIVVLNKVPLRADALAQAPRLKFVALAATGFDNVDVSACRERGIAVSNIRGYATNTVPEHTFALMLALARSLVPYRESVLTGTWRESRQFCYFDYPVTDLAGKTLGIIGDGPLGRAVGAIGRAFGMEVLFAAYKGVEGMGPLYEPFESTLRRSHVLTLHAPLLASTHNMIGDREFALMDQRPILINTARGGLVDEEALGRALTSGRISGAGFDVATVEPPPDDHPLMRLAASSDNFILTPHVAWSSREAIQSLANQLMENIERFWHGRPRHLVS